jgi:hypothetical protein
MDANQMGDAEKKSGLLYFVIGVVLALIIWGAQLIGIVVNVFLGGLILALAFGLVVYAFWIWERPAKWHVFFRIGTVIIGGILYFWLVGGQMVGEWRKEHPIVSEVKAPQSAPSPTPARTGTPSTSQGPDVPPPPKVQRTKLPKPASSTQEQSGGHENTQNQTGPVTQGPCSNFNQGGSDVHQGNNCMPPDRTISSAQAFALAEGVKNIPASIRIVVEHPQDSEASEYAKLIHDAIVTQRPVDIGTALSYGGNPPPKGLYVLAHSDDEKVLPYANHLYDLMKQSEIPCEAYQVDFVPVNTIKITVGVMPRPIP